MKWESVAIDVQKQKLIEHLVYQLLAMIRNNDKLLMLMLNYNDNDKRFLVFLNRMHHQMY